MRIVAQLPVRAVATQFINPSRATFDIDQSASFSGAAQRNLLRFPNVKDQGAETADQTAAKQTTGPCAILLFRGQSRR